MRNSIAKNIYSSMKQKIESVYLKHGYEEIDIPMFVRADLYEKYKGVPGNRFIKFLDRNGDVVVIRPDATFNILKKVNAKGNRQIQRYFYHTEIVRYKSEHYEGNEFMQSGIEFFNDNTPMCDGEVIAVAIKSLEDLGISGIRVDIGHSDFIYALFDGEKNLSKNDHQRIHSLIAQKNTMDLETFLKSKNIDSNVSKSVLDICMLFGDYTSVIGKAKQLCINERMRQALANIEAIYSCLKEYNLQNYIFIDLGFSNPMEYYSGMIFKVYADGAREELISGGRYDLLASKFGLRKYACGFGHNLNETASLIGETVYGKENHIVVNCPISEERNGISQAEKLRKIGLYVSLNPTEDQFSIEYQHHTYHDIEEVLDILQKEGYDD